METVTTTFSRGVCDYAIRAEKERVRLSSTVYVAVVYVAGINRPDKASVYGPYTSYFEASGAMVGNLKEYGAECVIISAVQPTDKG